MYVCYRCTLTGVCMMENQQRVKGLGDNDRATADEKELLGDLRPNYQYML